MPVTDFIYPRSPAAGNVVKPGNIDDFNFIRAQDSTSNTARITQQSNGSYPQRMSGAWTTRFICLSSDNSYHRSELNEWGSSQTFNQDRHGDGLERWFGFSFYWPSSVALPSGSGQWAILWQMHAGASGPSPTTSIQTQGGRLEVQHRWTGGEDSDIIFNPFPRDVWVDLLIRILFYPDSRGRKTIYAGTAQANQPFNPTRQIEFSGATRYSNLYGHIQCGIYRSYTTSQSYTLYMHRMRFRSSRSAIETALWGGAGPAPTPPTIPTTVTATLNAPDRIDWSVALPSDANRSGLQVAAFPRDPGSDLWTASDAISLYAASTTTTGQTITGTSPVLAPGTYTVRAWATGTGGNTGRSASPAITVQTSSPGDGRSFYAVNLSGTPGQTPGTPLEIRPVNQGTSAGVTFVEGGGISVTTQSANGSASRTVIELMEDLSFDFATGDTTRVLHVDFTVPTGSSELAIYLINASDTGTFNPLTDLTEFVRAILNMRDTTKRAILERRTGGVTTTLATVDLGTSQFGGTDAFLQLALDQTNVRAGYRFNGVSAAMAAQVAHGTALDLSNLRALIVPFQPSTAPSQTTIRKFKQMRRMPYAPTSMDIRPLKASGQAWVPGADDPDALSTIEVYGTFVSPDDSIPDTYRARTTGQEVIVPSRDLLSLPIELAPLPASVTPYTIELDAGNEVVI